MLLVPHCWTPIAMSRSAQGQAVRAGNGRSPATAAQND
jgi:hypothetical protein